MKTNSHPDRCSECLNIAELSDLVDGGGDTPPERRAHADSCPLCRSILEAMAEVDRAAGEAIRATAPAPDLPSRIIAAVAREREASARAARRSRLIPWVASSLAAAACLAIMFSGMFRLPDEAPGAPPTPGANAISAPTPFSPAETGSDGSGVDVSRLRLVSLGGDTRLAGAWEREPTAPGIPPLVRQVWVVDDPCAAARDIARMAADAAAAPGQAAITPSGNGSFSLVLETDKGRLVSFVRACSAKGYKLITPCEPQPESTRFACDPSDPVEYQAEFVPQ